MAWVYLMATITWLRTVCRPHRYQGQSWVMHRALGHAHMCRRHTTGNVYSVTGELHGELHIYTHDTYGFMQIARISTHCALYTLKYAVPCRFCSTVNEARVLRATCGYILCVATTRAPQSTALGAAQRHKAPPQAAEWRAAHKERIFLLPYNYIDKEKMFIGTRVINCPIVWLRQSLWAQWQG